MSVEEPKTKPGRSSRSRSPIHVQPDQYEYGSEEAKTMTVFKRNFKLFKAKRPPPSFETVVDIHQPDKWTCSIEPMKNSDVTGVKLEPEWLLSPADSWRIYAFRKHPGLILVRDPFLTGGHLLWSQKCLRTYTDRQLCTTNIDPHIEPDSVIFHNKRQLDRMRWSTLGYHYDWNRKIYTEEMKSPFPADLASMAAYIAHAVGFSNFRAEAAIVNYYHMDSTLSGHVDQSEFNLNAPLISLSLGQNAVFLLGGPSLDDHVSPLMLRSGDLMIMSGSSRLCYHAIPKILRSDTVKSAQFSEDPEVADYMAVNRVNVTVRQVNHSLLAETLAN